jgi:hypothetical protein
MRFGIRRPSGRKLSLPKAARAEWPKNTFEASSNRVLAIKGLDEGVCLTFIHHNCRRVVGVFTIGVSEAGRPTMSAWQVDGESNGRTIPSWGNFCFDECFDVVLSDRPMPPAPADYRKGAKNFKSIEREF